MRFGFTPDQLALAAGVHAVLTDHCPTSVLRSTAEGGLGPAEQLWHRLADLGLLGALLPEEDGGLGLNELDVLLGLEESGRFAVPLPLVETAVVAARLLAGPEHQERRAALAGGTLRVTAVLDGSALVPWVGFATAMLIGDESHVVLVPSVEAEPSASVDASRPVSTVKPGPGVLIDPAVVAGARRAGRLATAAQLIGLGERMLWMSVEHVRQRQQFGVPVGSFQAVKHALAEALRSWELARPLVHAAAWSHVHDSEDAERDVAAAKLRAGEAAGRIARTALQSHGATGYTQEYDLHWWLKRTWALQASWGQPGELRDQLAHALHLSPGGDHD